MDAAQHADSTGAVDALHEQRPVTWSETPETGRVLGTVSHLPWALAAFLQNEPRLNLRLAGETGDLVAAQ